MDIDAYIAANAPAWRRLEHLATQGRLTIGETDELITLYQRTGTHLSVLRSRTPDPLLLAWLSRVVLSARGRITGGAVGRRHALRRFLVEGFPYAVYQARRWAVGVAVLFLGFGTALGAAVASSPDLQARLLPPDAAQALVDHDFADYYHHYPAQHFALQVWTNNALLTGQVLAAGILVVPVLYLLFGNVLNVAADGGFLVSAGHGGEFFALILPHGMLELTAVFIGAGAGLRIGWGWIAPPPGTTRGRAVAEAARSAMLVALGLVVVLAVSGLIEAFVTPSPLPTWARIGIGAVPLLALLWYVTVCGRAATARAASADLDDELRGAAPIAV